MFNIKAFEAELTRFAIFSIALEIIALILFFLILYWVIKSAIRDGINESRLGERQRAIAKREDAEGLPPMRAER
ncbi:hypothetical protein GmRootA79_40600 [Acidovorax sp. A79]|uniref:hypothetical protein n=1 Tax=Acidovorax sp. A79 TaxID=3056107 RepID=UPI0034E8BF39